MPNPYSPKNPTQDALQRNLGAPTSNTMPVPGPRPQVPPAAGPQAFEGFDFGREQNTKKSAKDSFAALSKLAPTAPTHDKALLGQWADQWIKPGMNADGHGVSSITGDKLRFKNWQGEYDVDFGRGAGAPGGALAWQAEDVNGGQGGSVPSVPSLPSGGGSAPVMPGQTSDLMAEILAALQQSQEPDPQALLMQSLI